MSGSESIKKFCKLLSAYNVVRVEAYYDGSGDSGDIEQVSVITYPTPAQIDQAARQTTNPGGVRTEEKRTPFDQWKASVTAEPNALITKEACDEFLDELFALLPGGWEINDGSYGDITVDVASEKITVEHNERYTEVRSETFEY